MIFGATPMTLESPKDAKGSLTFIGPICTDGICPLRRKGSNWQERNCRTLGLFYWKKGNMIGKMRKIFNDWKWWVSCKYDDEPLKNDEKMLRRYDVSHWKKVIVHSRYKSALRILAYPIPSHGFENQWSPIIHLGLSENRVYSQL